MKIQKKILILTLITLACNNFWAAKSASISGQSYRSLLANALGGAAVGGALSFIGHSLGQYAVPTLDDIAEYKMMYGAISLVAALGSLILRYSQLPETDFNYASNGIENLSQNKLVMALVMKRQQSALAIIKDYYVRERFPLATAFHYLEKMHLEIQFYEDALSRVIASYRKDLYQDCIALLSSLERYQGTVKDAIKVIKDDPNFISENTALAQMFSAAAAQSAANAAWAQAMKPAQTTQITIY